MIAGDSACIQPRRYCERRVFVISNRADRGSWNMVGPLPPEVTVQGQARLPFAIWPTARFSNGNRSQRWRGIYKPLPVQQQRQCRSRGSAVSQPRRIQATANTKAADSIRNLNVSEETNASSGLGNYAGGMPNFPARVGCLSSQSDEIFTISRTFRESLLLGAKPAPKGGQ